MNTIIKGIAALSVLLVSTAALAQEFKTPLKVTKGQEFSYQIDMVMDITQSMAGQEIKVNNTTKSTSKNQITNVTAEGNAEVSSSAWDITSTAKTPMMDTTITMKGKVGPTFNILVDKFGNVLKKEKTDTRCLLITSAFHMKRSLGCFRKVHLDVTPYRTDFLAERRKWDPDRLLIPSANSLKDWHTLIREVVGYYTYKIAGYI
ncbi:MAG TPA: ElyC/SanA/YdcF family protein [Bacteroidales bacterium]|nr:ElyC/SanA/YdcF family protein [Bacteroidales bacterium]